MKNKNKLLVILFCFSSCSILAQNIQVLMSPKPSPYISDWQQQTETVKLVISNSSTKEIEVKIKTELYDGKGAVIANTDDSKMPVLTILPTSTTTYYPEDIILSRAIKYYGNLEKTAITTGRIPDDNYRLCVTLIDPQNGKPIGTSGTVCKVFTIVAYQAPTLISPASKAVIKGAAIKGIVFRWSPVIPSPKTIVTYRLQVWEVLEGQNSMTALRSNQPIIEKDLKGILQTQWPIDFPLPDTGKTYTWTITPLDDEGRKFVDGLGFSEPFEFRACCWPPPIRPEPCCDPDIMLITPMNNSEVSKDVTFSWTNTAAQPKDGYTIRIVELKGDQSPDVAIANNPAAFEQKGIMGKSFKLGDSVGKLKAGKKYVWSIGTENEKKSLVFARPFTCNLLVPGSGINASKFVLLTPINNTEITPVLPIKFEWKRRDVDPKGRPSSLIIFEISDKQYLEILSNKIDKIKIDKLLFKASDIKGYTYELNDKTVQFQRGHHYGWAVSDIRWEEPLELISIHDFYIFQRYCGSITPWADNNHDGIVNPNDEFLGDVQYLATNYHGFDNNMMPMTWSFVSWNATDIDPALSGQPFTIKIVKYQGSPVADAYYDSDGTYHSGGTGPTLCEMVTNVTPINEMNVPHTIVNYNSANSSTYSYTTYFSYLDSAPSNQKFVSGERYICQISIGCAIKCFSFYYSDY